MSRSLLLFAGLLLISVLSCNDRQLQPSPTDRPTTQVIHLSSGTPVLLTAQCGSEAGPETPPAQGPLTVDCVEIWGVATTINVTLGVNNLTYYACLGWGPDGTGSGYRYPIPPGSVESGIAVTTPVPWTAFASVLNASDASGYQFAVWPTHPTLPGAPLVVQCQLGSFPYEAAASVSLTLLPTTPVTLTSIVLDNMPAWLRAPGSQQAGLHYVDNYGGLNLMSPAPTFTWSSSNPSAVTATKNGALAALIAALTRGTSVVKGTSGTISGSASVLSVGCSLLTLSNHGPISQDVGTQAADTANPTCDQHINASAEPVAWSSSSNAVATVAGSGTGNHTGTITIAGRGTAWIKACTTQPPAPLPCDSVSVTGSQFVTVVRSPLDTIGLGAIVPPSSTGTLPFTVTNTGNRSGTATLSCVNAFNITCSGVTPASVTLNPGQTDTVLASYTTSATTGNAELQVNATGTGYDLLYLRVLGGPLSVTLTAPSQVKPNVVCEWIAHANGGIPPYTWQWSASGENVPDDDQDGDVYWTNEGSGFRWSVTVQDSLGARATTGLLVLVKSTAPTCTL